jgi:hydrogenase maturation protease
LKTLIAGIGSTIRGDDGVGVHLARRLQEHSLPENVDVVELGTAGLTLLDLAADYNRLIILDAMVSGAPPGTIHVLTGAEVARAAHLGVGHEADLPTTLALGRKLVGPRMPSEIVVVAIEASDLNSFSERLTEQVEAAIPEALSKVEERLTLRRRNP